MKIGIVLGDFSWPVPVTALGQQISGVARRADEAGIDSLWCMDHFFQIRMTGNPPESPMTEAYALLGVLAGQTERIRLGTLVTSVAYRHPGVLVKTVTTLDVLSGGRINFGVGPGAPFNPPPQGAGTAFEAEGLGIPFPPLRDRFEMLEEVLRVARQMWDGDETPFAGRYYQMARPVNSPGPVQRPRPPILVAGGGEKKTLRLVARYADACHLPGYAATVGGVDLGGDLGASWRCSGSTARRPGVTTPRSRRLSASALTSAKTRQSAAATSSPRCTGWRPSASATSSSRRMAPGPTITSSPSPRCSPISTRSTRCAEPAGSKVGRWWFDGPMDEGLANTTLREAAERHLRALAGEHARLREDQWTAISALVADRRRALVVQRTGWGKSAVYFIATALLRAAGAGPTVIVSPLLALMRNQVEAAARAGIRARTINSANTEEWQQVYKEVAAGDVDVLLVSPERLNNPGFRDQVLPRLTEAAGLIVIDEAHCISDWGHDFRPDYRRIRTLLGTLPPGIPVLATTATANARVTEDVAEQLGVGRDDAGQPGTQREIAPPVVLRGALDRESLRLAVVSLPTAHQRLGWLSARLADGSLPGSGIVYTLTVAAARETAAFLREQGIDVCAYSGKDDQVPAAAGRGRPAGQPGQGARRDQRAGHGLR